MTVDDKKDSGLHQAEHHQHHGHHDHHRHHENKPGKKPQVIAAVAATIGAFGMGATLGWTAPALPYLDEGLCGDDCDVSGITTDDASWIGSVVTLGALLSGPVSAIMLSKLGRKWTMISMSVPLFLGYLLFVLAYEFDQEWLIFVGRVVTGFAAGSFALAAPLYIVEIASADMRGSLASLMQFMLTIGIAFVNGLNIKDVVHWNAISAICMAIPALLAMAMFFMPESPYYLLSRGKEKAAEKSLRWLRGPDYDLSHELAELRKAEEAERATGSITLKQLTMEAQYAKPFYIVISLMFFQQFSGINVVIFYTQTIFLAAGSTIDPSVSAFIVGVAQVLGTGAAVMVVDRFGRRILLLVSDVLMCVFILLLGVYFYIMENAGTTCPDIDANFTSTESPCVPEEGQFDPDLPKQLGWLPLVSLITYILAFSVGFGPLPWALNAELHSEEAKALASAVGFTFNWLCAFIVTKFEPSLEEVIGASGAYFLFAAICAAGTVFVFFFVPETKGKSQEEIRALFQTRPKLDRGDGSGKDNRAFESA